MHHGVIVNDPSPEHLLPLLDYMYQEPEEMPRLFFFHSSPSSSPPPDRIHKKSNPIIQSNLPTPFLHYLPPTYLPRYGTYLSCPLERMEMTFVLILIYHLRHPSSREKKETHTINDQTKRRSGGRALSHSPSSLLGTCMYLGNVFLSSSSSYSREPYKHVPSISNHKQ